MAVFDELEASFGPKVSTEDAGKPDKTITLKGKYCTLEPWDKDHMASLWKNMALWENTKLLDYMPFDEGPPSEESMGKEIWQVVEKYGIVLYAIKANPERVNPVPDDESVRLQYPHTEVLGTIGFAPDEPSHRTLEVGLIIYGPALARSVAGTEAHYMLLHSVLDKDSPTLPKDAARYRRAAWRCNCLNKKSRRAAERMGYVYEGTWRKHWIVRGRSRDTDWLSLIDDDWPESKAVLEAWMRAENFNKNGRQIKTVDEIRAALK